MNHHTGTLPNGLPLACVMGSMDLLRPLALAGYPCAALGRPDNPTLASRYARTTLSWDDAATEPEALVEKLVAFGLQQDQPPVLFYEEDSQLLMISRYRSHLARAFRFVIADAGLVEDLVDKSRFRLLAERLDLPVPKTRLLRPAAMDEAPDLDLRFPVIIKPTRRTRAWLAMGEAGKAHQVDSPAGLRALWPQLAAGGQDLLAQEMIPGPESRIESYHVFVDHEGAIAGEFTGRKIRTYPEAYGHTTALIITDEADVAALGRDLTRRLDLRGVAKFDFKRAPDGSLHLLEVNPRFNLWHLAGALAGVNLPALVYADLLGLPRPAVRRARAGVEWCHMVNDFAAARASGTPLAAWALWALRCDGKSAMAWDDPMPLLRGAWRRFAARRTATRDTTATPARG
ncbi:ATP-grasp domain-containing protein [Azospirillum sp.]|uniref:carboxylate--amine ligase n=1 Tax=Azospirillum sp. TaxID=34012 RepID=UPI003D71CC73